MSPAVSKSQYRMMQGICKGSIKPRKGLPSKKTACEFIEKTKNVKRLPERKKK